MVRKMVTVSVANPNRKMAFYSFITTRKLTAVLSADVEEHSRLMSQDERGTIGSYVIMIWQMTPALNSAYHACGKSLRS